MILNSKTEVSKFLRQLTFSLKFQWLWYFTTALRAAESNNCQKKLKNNGLKTLSETFWKFCCFNKTKKGNYLALAAIFNPALTWPWKWTTPPSARYLPNLNAHSPHNAMYELPQKRPSEVKLNHNFFQKLRVLSRNSRDLWSNDFPRQIYQS